MNEYHLLLIHIRSLDSPGSAESLGTNDWKDPCQAMSPYCWEVIEFCIFHATKTRATKTKSRIILLSTFMAQVPAARTEIYKEFYQEFDQMTRIGADKHSPAVSARCIWSTILHHRIKNVLQYYFSIALLNNDICLQRWKIYSFEINSFWLQNCEPFNKGCLLDL